jgi:hypothetical protein
MEKPHEQKLDQSQSLPLVVAAAMASSSMTNAWPLARTSSSSKEMCSSWLHQPSTTSVQAVQS